MHHSSILELMDLIEKINWCKTIYRFKNFSKLNKNFRQFNSYFCSRDVPISLQHSSHQRSPTFFPLTSNILSINLQHSSHHRSPTFFTSEISTFSTSEIFNNIIKTLLILAKAQFMMPLNNISFSLMLLLQYLSFLRS